MMWSLSSSEPEDPQAPNKEAEVDPAVLSAAGWSIARSIHQGSITLRNRTGNDREQTIWFLLGRAPARIFNYLVYCKWSGELWSSWRYIICSIIFSCCTLGGPPARGGRATLRAGAAQHQHVRARRSTGVERKGLKMVIPIVWMTELLAIIPKLALFTLNLMEHHNSVFVFWRKKQK